MFFMRLTASKMIHETLHVESLFSRKRMEGKEYWNQIKNICENFGRFPCMFFLTPTSGVWVYIIDLHHMICFSNPPANAVSFDQLIASDTSDNLGGWWGLNSILTLIFFIQLLNQRNIYLIKPVVEMTKSNLN